MGIRFQVFGLALSMALVRPTGAQQPQRADFTQFVVMGEGVSAGFADFSLREPYQRGSFPALIAAQMKVLFPQPLIQSPGLGNIPGFGAMPARIPATLQTTVRVASGPKPPNSPPERQNAQPPIDLFVFNVSIPNQKVADALSRKPVHPLIQQNDMQQTLINFILGFPGMVVGANKPVWTQLEYVQQMKPTYVMLALGYSDVLEAAALGNPALLPDQAAFRTNYSAIMAGLKTTFAPVLIVNVPDPTDTAYFSTLAAASRMVVAPPSVLMSLYNLRADDQITIPGLIEIGNQLNNNRPGPLPPGSIVSAATINAIKASIRGLNTEIANQAQQNGAVLYDLASLVARLRSAGAVAGGKALTADYLGGIYSLSGLFPGTTGHALIANDILNLINRTHGTSFPLVDVNRTAADDPAGRFMPATKRPAAETN